MNAEAPTAGLAGPRVRLWTALACMAIVAAGIGVYSNSFRGPFIFDDALSIQNNPTIRHFPAWRNLVPPQANPLSRRPVVNLSFAINHALGGADVRGYHAVNLLIHLLAALALFGVVRWTLRTAWTKERTADSSSVVQGPSSIVAVAFAVALLWTVHPLQTEAVAYLTQRTELLVGLFYLLTLYAVIRGASSAHPWRWYSLSIAACALGMGSKEVMATAPLIVLLYDRCFLSGSFREAIRRRGALHLGLAATWAVLIALLIAYPWGAAAGAGFGISAMTPWQYARTQAGVVLHYFALSFWPRGLCLDYAWPVAYDFWKVAPAALAILALLAGTAWALRRAPKIGFLGAWVFLILAPSSSIVPISIEVAAERRMYLPLAAIIAGCVLAVRWAVRRQRTTNGRREPAAIAAMVFLSTAGAFACMTFNRLADYASAVSIWKDTVRKAPWSARAQSGLGAAYLAADRYDEAVESFSRAIALKPDDFTGYINRAAALAQADRFAEALRALDKAGELKKDSAAVHCGRAAVYLRARDSNAALAEFDRAIAVEPDSAAAYDQRGNALAGMNRPAEAVRDYDRAIALKPDFAAAYNDRGVAYAKAERLADAVRDYTAAVGLEPDFTQALCNRASAWLRLGRYDRTVSDCDRVLALDPNFRDAYLNRAAAYSQIGEVRKAMSDVRAFQRLGGRPPEDFLRALEQAAGRAE